MKTKKFEIGNVIKIKIDEKNYGFGRVIGFPFIEFYNLKVTDADLNTVSANNINSYSTLFTIAVHKSCLSKGNWEVIGNNPTSVPPPPAQFTQSLADPSKLIIIEGSGHERKATLSEVQGLEKLAVWEPENVEDRLRDYFNNKSNFWVERMKPKAF